MKKIIKLFVVLAMSMALLPSMALAGNKERTFVGNGMVEGWGRGAYSFEGNGEMNVMTAAPGILTYSKNANVELTGRMGIRTETETLITLTGFHGTAMIWGDDVFGSFSGESDDFMLMGEGRVQLEGSGMVHAERWNPVHSLLAKTSLYSF